jgi:hypothetical protein
MYLRREKTAELGTNSVGDTYFRVLLSARSPSSSRQGRLTTLP